MKGKKGKNKKPEIVITEESDYSDNERYDPNKRKFELNFVIEKVEFVVEQKQEASKCLSCGGDQSAAQCLPISKSSDNMEIANKVANNTVVLDALVDDISKSQFTESDMLSKDTSQNLSSEIMEISLEDMPLIDNDSQSQSSNVINDVILNYDIDVKFYEPNGESLLDH